MEISIRCPLIPQNVYSQGCHEKHCMYHTILNKNGCSHGSPVTIQTWARNKGVTQKSVKQSMALINDQVQHALLMYAYIQFCPEQSPAKHDVEEYERYRNKLPYRIPPIATIFNAQKLTAMKNIKIFEQFCRLQRIAPEMPLQQFLFHDEYSESSYT